VQIVRGELRARKPQCARDGGRRDAQAACLCACSACSGDYEDSGAHRIERRVREEGAEEASADHAERSVPREGCPVREK